MPGDRATEVTELLNAASTEGPGALERVLPLVYEELRMLADRYLRDERPNHTLQTTALVHEAYLRLVDAPNVSWENRRHFFGIAAHAMRQILVDHARRRTAAKRDGGRQVTLEDDAVATPTATEDILGVDEVLHRLAAQAPRAAQVVELRYFAGLSIEQTAETLDVSVATVKRDWLMARAWLQRELS